MPEAEIEEIQSQIEEASAFVETLKDEIGRVVVGQKHLVERLIIGLISGGHVLLEGVPGLAKTLTIRSLSDAIGTSFQRIQFTPDLLPADLLGTLVYNQEKGEFTIKKGPIFANLILADEINRSPAKVQSALLESMQERQVTIGETTFQLDEPFLVLATQNPIEQEGTYPLPEAQVDRFMMKVIVGYPSREEELDIMRRHSRTHEPSVISKVVDPSKVLAARGLLDELYVDERVEEYMVELVLASRYPGRYQANRLEKLIEYGGSPRATINLNRGARAHAFLEHRAYVTPEDVRAVAPDVMRHRILPSFEAEAEGISTDVLIQQLLDSVEVP